MKHIFIKGKAHKKCSNKKCINTNGVILADGSVVLEIGEFCKNNRQPDKLHWYCKICHASRTATYTKNNPEKVKKLQATYRQNNPEKIIAYRRKQGFKPKKPTFSPGDSKICLRCGKEKKFEEYYKGGDGYCKECLKKLHRLIKKLKKVFPKPAFIICPICKNWVNIRICMDHDHDTGKFRGWLCSTCNTGLGHLNHYVKLIQKAILYLKQYPDSADKLIVSERWVLCKHHKDEKVKYCSGCNTYKNIEEFGSEKNINRNINGTTYICKECIRKLSNEKNKILREHPKPHNIICPICGKYSENVNVDHNHDTGEFRAYICGKCNSGLGNLKDNIQVLKNAITYLENINNDVINIV